MLHAPDAFTQSTPNMALRAVRMAVALRPLVRGQHVQGLRALSVVASGRTEQRPRWGLWAAAAGVAAVAGAGVAMCEPPTSPTPAKATSPFDYLITSGVLEQRAATEEQLRDFIEKELPKIRAAMEENVAKAQKKLKNDPAALEKEVLRIMHEAGQAANTEWQRIVYGVTQPGLREQYDNTYGCVKWTDKALQRTAQLSPLIEIGAGAGHWQRELTRVGASVIAFDNFSTPQPAATMAGIVHKGDERQIPFYPDHTLFLCFPPDTPMALNALRMYTGEYLVYVGEGRGGVNADAAFFDMLDAEYDVIDVIDLDPFPRCYEKLFVLRHKTRRGKPSERTWKGWMKSKMGM